MGNLTFRIARKLIYKNFLRKGYYSYAASILSGELAEEFAQNPENIPFSDRKKAWKLGYTAANYKFYKLDKNNINDYVSDFEYYSLFPFNNKFSHLIDDKLTFKYVLNKFDNFLPAYYFIIDNKGNIQDFFENKSKSAFLSVLDIIECLKTNGVMILKPYFGAAGEKIIKVEYKDGKFFVSGNEKSENEFAEFLKSLRGYICSEFVQQSSEFERLCPGIAHTVRLQTYKNKKGEYKALFSFVRIGRTSQKDCVTHSTAGITAAVNVENGQITNPFWVDEKGNYLDAKIHPETGEKVDFIIPRWNEIVAKCLEIHKHLGVLNYLGFDVILTDELFKICEINSASSIRAYQRSFPLKKSADFCEFLEHMKNK